MQITRAKATALLNKGEMQLYDDSRHNAIRGFSAAQLDSRVTRARSARNRARDLVQRQKLASRARTGSKRGTSGAANQRSKDKAEILADILKRFEAQLKEARQAEKAAATKSGGAGKAAKGTGKGVKKAAKKVAKKVAKKASPKKAPARKAAAKKASTRKTATKKAPARKATAKKAPARKAAAKKTAAKKVAKRAPGQGKRAITPKKALRNTLALLEAKQEQARQPRPWQEVSGHDGQVSGDGFQSTAAAHRAEELHAAQSRIPAIHGSIGTRGRLSQGKRDNRGGGEE